MSAEFHIPKPLCCKEIREFPVIAADLDHASEDTAECDARWYIRIPHRTLRGYERSGDTPPVPTHCPFCGSGLPTLVKRAHPPKGIERVTDGGYYCDTCGQRCSLGCACPPAISAFQVDRGSPLLGVAVISEHQVTGRGKVLEVDGGAYRTGQVIDYKGKLWEVTSIEVQGTRPKGLVVKEYRNA